MTTTSASTARSRGFFENESVDFTALAGGDSLATHSIRIEAAARGAQVQAKARVEMDPSLA